MAFSAVRNIVVKFLLVIFLTAASPFLIPAHADDLDGEALNDLALRGQWQAEHAEYGFWTWSEDGAVCLRVGSRDGECADTGTWKIADNVLCYELTWWGESVGERASCFTVQALGDDHFETLFHGGAMVSRMFAFKVLD